MYTSLVTGYLPTRSPWGSLGVSGFQDLPLCVPSRGIDQDASDVVGFLSEVFFMLGRFFFLTFGG